MWLDALQGAPGPTRTKAAERLLRLNEHYFNDNKISVSDRANLVVRLESLSRDSETLVRQCVAQLFGLLQFWNEKVHDLLCELLHDEQTEVHVNAIWATARIGRQAAELCPAIARLAESCSHDVRWRVAWALGELGYKSAELRNTLLILSEDPSCLIRMHSIQSFGRCADMPDRQVYGRLLTALDDSDGSVRGAACRAIASLPCDWNDQLPRIRKLALHDRMGAQLDAMVVLVKYDPNCMRDPPVRAWLEANRGYWWVDELFSNDGDA